MTRLLALLVIAVALVAIALAVAAGRADRRLEALDEWLPPPP